MTDYTELKRAAKAASQGRWNQDGFDVQNDDIEDYRVSRCNLLADAKFIAAANPAAVLALIAENERVKARLCVCRDCGGRGDVYSGHSSYQGYSQPPEPDMDVCGTCGGEGVLGPLEDFESLAAERDQLKAELSGLRTGYEAYESVNKGLKAENETLVAAGQALRDEWRKDQSDAERYRYLRDRCGLVEYKVIAGSIGPGMLPSGEKLDVAIDAAMGKGEQA